jgi:hypothetical protein
MFTVTLMNPENFVVGEYDAPALGAAKLAGATCYQPNADAACSAAKKINAETVLFKTGHHTTFQHPEHMLKFYLDNVPVSLVTFGLHMTHPFYNTSQRSGRYCMDMFTAKSHDQLEEHIESFLKVFTNINDVYHPAVTGWVFEGINFFNENIDAVTALAKDALFKERPNYKGDFDNQARRIAQDQLRCVISTIVPTGLQHTINLTTLYAMNLVAWNYPLKVIFEKMHHELLLRNFPNMIKGIKYTAKPFIPHFENYGDVEIATDVVVTVGAQPNDEFIDLLTDTYLSKENLRNLNILPFSPVTNTMGEWGERRLLARIEVPVITYGQDQRHRTIKRSNPVVLNKFYLPPLLRQLPGAAEFCKEYTERYFELCTVLGKGDMLHFIPYGVMLRYTKTADVNAYLHCVNKRLCWNAESTIANLERKILTQLYESDRVPIGPPCEHGACHEGKRFCGRNLKNRDQRDLI